MFSLPLAFFKLFRTQRIKHWRGRVSLPYIYTRRRVGWANDLDSSKLLWSEMPGRRGGARATEPERGRASVLSPAWLHSPGGGWSRGCRFRRRPAGKWLLAKTRARLATHCTMMSGGDLQPCTYMAGRLPRRDTLPFTPRRPVVLS